MSSETQKLAEERYANIKADFPGIDTEMAGITELLYALAGELPLKDVIYKSLMTGATLIHERHKKAEEASQDVLSGLLQKGGTQDMPPGLFKKQ